MRAEVPTLAAAGVPDRRPVVVLNVAQLGWFWIEYSQRVAVRIAGRPAESCRQFPAVTRGRRCAGDGRRTVGRRGGVAHDRRLNGGSSSLASPSLTVMTIAGACRHSRVVGVPAARPVAAVKVIQPGRFVDRVGQRVIVGIVAHGREGVESGRPWRWSPECQRLSAAELAGGGGAGVAAHLDAERRQLRVTAFESLTSMVIIVRHADVGFGRRAGQRARRWC